MGYSAADESFAHQLPATFDQVHSADPTWSDRCYFFAASPDELGVDESSATVR